MEDDLPGMMARYRGIISEAMRPVPADIDRQRHLRMIRRGPIPGFASSTETPRWISQRHQSTNHNNRLVHRDADGTRVEIYFQTRNTDGGVVIGNEIAARIVAGHGPGFADLLDGMKAAEGREAPEWLAAAVGRMLGAQLDDLWVQRDAVQGYDGTGEIEAYLTLGEEGRGRVESAFEAWQPVIANPELRRMAVQGARR